MNYIKVMKQSDLYCFLKRNYFRLRTMLVPKKWYAVVSYNMRYKKRLHIDNPQTFDEKLWWLKLNYLNPLQTVCADKIKVRDYVAKCGLEDILIKSYGYFDTFDDIDLTLIPDDEFFLKCNHLSGGNMIIKKGVTNINKARKQFNHWLKDNAYYYYFEWPYKNMKPGLIAEKILRHSDGKPLLDYKFMCFEGEPKLLFLDIGVCEKDGSHAENYFRNIYDMDFKLLEITETRSNKVDKSIVKPDNFEYMKECVSILSKPFPHCRVDLYNVDGKVYFGEITFYHGSGYNDIKPLEADKMIGSWIDIEHHNNYAIVKSELFPYYEKVNLNKKQ